MKNLLLGLCLLMPFLSNSQNIKEFYDLFEHSMRKSCQNTTTNQVMIDDKSNFIRIQNPQDLDDAISFKCFIKDDKSGIFGFQYSASQPGLGLIMTRTEFYTYNNKQWKNVTNEVCPTLSFKDFWGNQSLPDKSLQEFNLHLILPQAGTTIVAKSAPAVKVQFPYDILPKDYSATFEKRKFKNIELNWNKTTGKFEVGRKS